MTNKVSVIMPCYNAASHIERSIMSVMKQKYNNVELLICDDASTDSSVNLIKGLQEKFGNIKLIEFQKNRGPAAARNAAIDASTGSYIAFLDSDDLWHESFLDRQLKSMYQSGASAIYSSCRRVDETGTPILSDFIVPERVCYEDLLKSNSVPCLTCIVKRELVGETRMKDHVIEDLNFWLDLLKKVDFFYGNQEVLADYTLRQGARSSNKTRLIKPQWCTYRVGQGKSFISSVYYLAHWAINGVLKYRK